MNLKKLRQAKNLTQAQLSAISSVPQSKICEYEKNRTLPRLDTAEKLARALGCTLDELAGLTERAG